jgi:ketosteroid isomerase-like protein
MSIELNKQLIVTFFAALNSGKKEAILQVLEDDFAFQGMGRHPDWIRYRWDREAFADAPRNLAALMKKPIFMNLRGMIAEGDRIAVQADSSTEMKNGKTYDNAYLFIFTIKNDKVKEVQEYCCTYTVSDRFGEYLGGAAAG